MDLLSGHSSISNHLGGFFLTKCLPLGHAYSKSPGRPILQKILHRVATRTGYLNTFSHGYSLGFGQAYKSASENVPSGSPLAMASTVSPVSPPINLSLVSSFLNYLSLLPNHRLLFYVSLLRDLSFLLQYRLLITIVLSVASQVTSASYMTTVSYLTTVFYLTAVSYLTTASYLTPVCYLTSAFLFPTQLLTSEDEYKWF